MATWFQDDWRISDQLTLNVGIRWDADLGVMGEKKQLLPWMSGDRPHQLDWVQPRVGFAYRLENRTVLRGGLRQVLHAAGERRGPPVQPEHPDDHSGGRLRRACRLCDESMGRSASAFDQQAQSRLCSTALTPGCIRREITSEIPTTIHDNSYSHQTMVGMSRQLGTEWAVEVSYQYTGSAAGGSDEQPEPDATTRHTGDNIPVQHHRVAGLSGMGIHQRRVHAGVVELARAS